MSKQVAVVILNFNGVKFLEQFLPITVKYSQHDAEIIVADNNSTDQSIHYIKNTFPAIRIIQNKTNGGFSKGYNDALKEIDAEYAILLNSDVEVTPNWIPPLIDKIESDQLIVACQPKILAFNDKKRFEYAGAAGGYIDKYGYPFCRGRIFDSFENDNGQYNDTREVHWATGACLVIKTAKYKEVGGLDEDFFAHMEEIDLCWRLKNRGYKIMYVAESTVYHVGAGTLAKSSPKKTFLNFRNNLILLCKNHSHQLFWLKLFLRMSLDGLAGIKFLLSGDSAHFVAVIKAHASFYSTFYKTLEKRKKLKQQVARYSTSAIYGNSIVIDYYWRKKHKFSELDPKGFGIKNSRWQVDTKTTQIQK